MERQQHKYLFVAGPGRSGTTLLTLMLSRHPDISLAPENHFFPGLIKSYGNAAALGKGGLAWLRRAVAEDDKLHALKCDISPFLARVAEYGEDVPARQVAQDFLADHAAASGHASLWLGQKKNYLDIWPELKAVFPQARMIAIFRDCRDTAFSAAQNLPGQTLASAARSWAVRAQKADAFRKAFPGDYFELQYEKFVAEPEGYCREVCKFLGLPFSPAMLSHHEENPQYDRVLSGHESKHARTAEPVNAQRVARWRRDLSAWDVALIEHIAGPWMIKRGYKLVAQPHESRFVALRAGADQLFLLWRCGLSRMRKMIRR